MVLTVFDLIYRVLPDPKFGVTDPKTLVWTPRSQTLGSVVTPKI